MDQVCLDAPPTGGAHASAVLPGQQADLFADAQRWPRKPYCTDDLAAGLRIRALRTAVSQRYIQANRPDQRAWMIHDVDRPGAADAWQDANLPPPTWAAINRRNGHAHLCWGLDVPVVVLDEARRAPIRYLAAIEHAYGQALQADPGYTGLIAKNPGHETWLVERGPKITYELGELAEWVNLPQRVPKRSETRATGIGRNVSLFDSLRTWAYTAVRKYRGDHRNLVAWQAATFDRAGEINGQFDRPLSWGEVRHVVRSVVRWVWKQDGDAEGTFLARQAHRGRASGTARAVNAAQTAASALKLQRNGLSQAVVAAELGVHVNSLPPASAEARSRAGAAGGQASGIARLAAAARNAEAARALRRAGRSVAEICIELGVHRSSVSRWCKSSDVA